MQLGGMDIEDRVGDYRRRMRQRGYLPVQVWVPDVRTEQFAAEARRQAALAATVDRGVGDRDFIEAVAVPLGDE